MSRTTFVKEVRSVQRNNYVCAMGKLPHAPLVEVVTEIRWVCETEDDRNAFQFLTGDLYSLVKNRFPFREVVIPAVIPIEAVVGRPTLRFRTEKDGYPLIQVGPGLLTVNTVGDEYDWDTHRNDISFVLENFFNSINLSSKSLSVTLAYIDFLSFDFEKNNILAFLSKKLHTDISMKFIGSEGDIPQIFNLTVGYSESVGTVNINVARGQNNAKEDGVAIQTNIVMSNIAFNQSEIELRLDKAHDRCSDLFKLMTKGELYESFEN